ncbi:homoserine kinase, partial [candidate division KSB1 bacterium]|nr:homoserine kinase [candidate division KSB1 bacterium]
MLHIKIPASTSNLGAGFDVIGLALNMYLDIRVETLTGGRKEWRFHGEGRGSILADSPDNFIIKTLNTVLSKRGVENPGFGISVRNQIPLSRGLGS